MVFSFTIAGYLLHVYGGSSDKGRIRRVIQLSDNNGVIRASIYFYGEEFTPQDSSVYEIQGIIRATLQMNEHEYSDVVDLLRNEKPLYFRYHGGNFNIISTSETETPGENEPA